MDRNKIRLIAFYLPQYHPIPENDEWWGQGFTEWSNVLTARPRFRGHYQPHIPADLGFYDLRVPEVREAQAQLAEQYGISGFCYYHYWFNGRRVLERPFNEVLKSGKPEFPFCLCWANENWTRAWDGRSGETLLQQFYGPEDDCRHIRALVPALGDPRYIRVDGRPLLLVYRTELLPDPSRTAEIWREEAVRAGIGDLYLARVESFVWDLNPRTIGFDAAVEFAPDWRCRGKLHGRDWLGRITATAGLVSRAFLENEVGDYADLMEAMLAKPIVSYERFRGVTPGFDNSARRARGALIFAGADPDRYGAWLTEIVRRTIIERPSGHRLVFVNAWNEWAEGNHLEPDQHWGRAFLEATRRAAESYS